jgi:hypothetical protein
VRHERASPCGAFDSISCRIRGNIVAVLVRCIGRLVGLCVLGACGSDNPRAQLDSLVTEIEAKKRFVWEVDSQRSAVDDTKKTRLSLQGMYPGESEPNFRAPYLYIVCERGSVQVGVMSVGFRATEMPDGRAAVRWRVSGQTPKIDTWIMGNSNLGGWSDRPRELLKALLAGDTLALEIDGSEVVMGHRGDAILPIADLRSQLALHAPDCLPPD